MGDWCRGSYEIGIQSFERCVGASTARVLGCRVCRMGAKGEVGSAVIHTHFAGIRPRWSHSRRLEEGVGFSVGEAI
jgi:hypothetical protein